MKDEVSGQIAREESEIQSECFSPQLPLHRRHCLSTHRIPVALRSSWGHHFAVFEFRLLSSNLFGQGVSALDLI
jgi:hypothetical protein